MDLGLEGRIAIVTGGGGPGNGGHISRTLAAEGATVLIVDLDTTESAVRVAEIHAAGGSAQAISADAASWEETQRVVQQALDAHGQIDILVNSAAAMGSEPFLESGPADWSRYIDGCLVATMNYCRAVLPSMQERRYGRIVNIVSDAARVGETRLAAYSAAKGGVIGFTRALAHETGRHGIAVNNVSPAVTERPNGSDPRAFWGASGKEGASRRAAAMRRYPLGLAYQRLGRPQDVANAVAFLSSDAAAWITGQTLSVNGGYVMP